MPGTWHTCNLTHWVDASSLPVTHNTCPVQEQRAERALVRAALVLVGVQAACMWAILSAAVQQAQKLRQE